MEQGSYVSGTGTIPLIGETIGRHFDRAVARWGDRDGIVVRHQDVRWTYGELAAHVDALAAGLVALGLEPGDRIGIWSPNNAEWVQMIFAAPKAGLILVNINPAYRLSELEHALNLSGCKALVTASRFKTSDYLGMLRELAPELATAKPGALQAAKLPDLRTIIHLDPAVQPGMLKFADVAPLGGEAERTTLKALAGRLQFDDPVNIQFTSGTTGLPKGATLTHHNILNNGFFVAEAMGLREGDRAVPAGAAAVA